MLQNLLTSTPLINPSLLAADFGSLEREIRQLESGGAKILHLDIMDGHFVPNLSFGIPVVKAIRRITDLPLDVHLMLDNADRFLVPFCRAGADFLTVHIEVYPDPRPILEKIRSLGAEPGVAINPSTPAKAIVPYLNECSLVLTMSVTPGFGGQEFDPAALDKIRAFRDLTGPGFLLSVDGGVNEETIARCAAAGANLFVAGTAVFNAEDYGKRMRDLLAKTQEVFSAPKVLEPTLNPGKIGLTSSASDRWAPSMG